MRNSAKRGTGTILTAALVSLALLLAGCEAGGPAPSPPGSSATPGPSEPTLSAPANAAASVHFTTQGDIGVKKTSQHVLDTIADLKPQFNLALGDFTYKAGIEQQFCDMVKGKLGENFPYEVLTGNHESDGSDGDIANIVKCLPNKLPGIQGEYGTQWYVDVPETNPLVRFVMVSPGIDFQNQQHLDFSKGSDRWNWTTNAIDGATAAKIPWTVVGMHAPCLSVGKYDCKVGQDFATMLLEKKVDLVLTGHDHIYQRTHQLALGTACPALVPNELSPNCITDSDSSMAKGAGTVFVTVGVGGESLYDVNNNDSEAGYFTTWSGGNRDPAFGTLDVTATADQLSARLVPAKGYTFTDAFTIARY
ncbi:metallophosphoesterase [Pseudarthrobacter sp. O4]|uniref:metallophosphoesterase n=1 Tax=Pseudarthrobacter sp. O4 TaxID=3418417 RepID=UPI003CF140CB